MIKYITLVVDIHIAPGCQITDINALYLIPVIKCIPFNFYQALWQGHLFKLCARCKNAPVQYLHAFGDRHTADRVIFPGVCTAAVNKRIRSNTCYPFGNNDITSRSDILFEDSIYNHKIIGCTHHNPPPDQIPAPEAPRSRSA